ncbi:MAG TPA: thioredoxin-dependent thiol peroxidase [Nitrososphaeraceae archaeon]|nr:thioredoxin-dependent thiol peroxidase [Nitrososphaeraceae archaeon]
MSQEFHVREGNMAPDFIFKDSDNNDLRLSNFLGKRIVIYFYPNDFTPGCTTQASEFSMHFNKYLENNIIIIGISPNDETTHQEFKEKMRIPFLLISDSNNKISQQYGVYKLKKFMGKEYMGVMRTTFLIDKHGKIAKIFYKVKPKGHSTEVLDFFLRDT